MFPGVHLPFDFKMLKFEKYDRHGDPVAYLRLYCNQLRGARRKEELLMAYFEESLSGLASEWFVDQDIGKWISWDDLANGFVQQFQYNVELIPDEKSLTGIKKKNTESFREYAIRWREQAARVKLPMKESKIVEVQAFIEVLKMGEMIEDRIKTGRIVSFATLKETTKAIQKGSKSLEGKKNEEDASTIIVGTQARKRGPYHRYPRAQTQVYGQAPQNLYQNPLYSIPPSPYQVYTPDPHSRSFDRNVRCTYHSDVQGHSIEDCRALKREIEKMIQDKSIMVQNIDSKESSSHANMQTNG
ncbi:hypothetical protein P3L10_000389 [Capsicum annuum]